MSREEAIKETERALESNNWTDTLTHCHQVLELLKSEPEPGEFTKTMRPMVKAFQEVESLRDAANTSLDEIDHLTTELAVANETFHACREALDEKIAKIDRLTAELADKDEILQKIRNWCEVYPLEVFPELTKDEWKHADEILKAHGLSLSSMSVSNKRQVINGIKRILEVKQ